MQIASQRKSYEPLRKQRQRQRPPNQNVHPRHSTNGEHFAAIEILSNPETGTCISVYFPATDEPLAGDGDPAQAIQTAIDNENCLGTTILTVDDDDLVRYSFVAMLKHAGFCTEAG